jgi:endonuclease YncB( thermonuclease family)
LLLPVAAEAQQITGQAEVVESDIIKIGEQRIMLYGIESIEPRQTCEIDRQQWECWAAAVRELQTIVSEGEVTCDPVGNPDPYGRILANCSVHGEDIATRFVRSGFALALKRERPELEDVQKEARAEKIGLWQGRFATPTEWRAMNGIFVDRP